MPREKSPAPVGVRLAKVDTTAPRPKTDQPNAQTMPPPSASLPPPKLPTMFAPKEALSKSAILVDQIPTVVEQMKFHKKQARRLAELASFVYDSIESSIPKPPPDDISSSVSEGLEKLIRTLYRIEERLRDVGSGNLVTRMNELSFVQFDLTELEDECSEVASMFGIDAPVNSERTQKAKHEDELALKDLAARLEKDPDELADKIGLRGSKLDDESQKSLQIMLYSIEHSPDKVLPEFKTFAESAARTIFSRTKQEIPRDLPWHVRPREFKQGKKIGDGGFSTVFKGLWTSRQIEVAIKVFEEQGENIDKLIKEIVIWKDHEHPCLLKFFAGCLFDKPKFIVSPYCKNGNALDYLQIHPDGDRAKMLLDVSRGMLYLHSAKIVHGDLKARNVLISDEGRALVADFGLAEFERHDILPSRAGSASSGTGEKTPRLIGTPHWLAPECFKDGVQDRKFADVWAMGMLSYELYENGKVPLGHIPIKELSDKLEAGERPSRPTAHTVPEYIWKMMELCWSLNTIDRPSFSEITMVLGLFQDADLETLQEISREFSESGYILRSNISKWPGLLERLVEILTVTLKLGPIKSAADQPDPALLSQLSPAAEQQVVSALTVLKDITSYYMYDGLQQQLIYDAGVLPALHYILKRKEEIQNPEIMTLGCQIVANLLRSPDGDTKKNDLARGDFVDALVELIDSPGPKVATHAMSTVRTLINSYGWGINIEEQLAQKKRVVDVGLVPKLITICKDGTETDAVCESLDFITLLGMSPTSLTEEHVREMSPVLIERASSEADLKTRQYALYALAKITECSEEQAGYVRSCKLFPRLLELLHKQGPELFDGGYFTAGTILVGIAEEEHIPAILELLQKPDVEPTPDAFGAMVSVSVSIKQNGCLALAAIATRIAKSDERQALAHKYPVFNVLQPLLSSTNDMLVSDCRKALALYSSPQDFPFVMKLLGDASSAARLMAAQICVTLVESASEDDKIAAANSGILPALKAILDDPPPPPPPMTPLGGSNPLPENIPLPPSPILDIVETQGSPRPVTDSDELGTVGAQLEGDMGAMNSGASDAESSLRASDATAQSSEHSAAKSVLGLGLGSASPDVTPSPVAASADESHSQTSQGDGVSPNDASSAISESHALVSDLKDSAVPEASPHVAPAAQSSTPKQPRSPRVKGVTFDSVEHIISIDTKPSEDEDESVEVSGIVAGSPRSLHDTNLHESNKELVDKSKASAEQSATADAKNKEEIYLQAFTALDHIITDVSKDVLDTLGEAYITANIHESLISRLSADPVALSLEKTQLTTLWMLYRLSNSTDDVRLALVHSGILLPKLRAIIDSEPGTLEAQQYACNVVQGLLSDEGDDDEVMDAVVSADLVPPLAKYMKNDLTIKTWGAQVLSQLIWIFDNETPEESVTMAITSLDEYCSKAPENIEETFDRRMYIIVDYLLRPLPKVKKLGLSLALAFAKRSVDHRRTLANLTGLRDAVDACSSSEDEEISSVAKDILEKIKPKRGVVSSRNLRSARHSGA